MRSQAQDLTHQRLSALVLLFDLLAPHFSLGNIPSSSEAVCWVLTVTNEEVGPRDLRSKLRILHGLVHAAHPMHMFVAIKKTGRFHIKIQVSGFSCKWKFWQQ